ncbi:hypothetical protein KEM54_000152 [Ascosphaera aggregata]|nr:hypothetical protein KEM54_000152 [Ascosphaera aggregata]
MGLGIFTTISNYIRAAPVIEAFVNQLGERLEQGKVDDREYTYEVDCFMEFVLGACAGEAPVVFKPRSWVTGVRSSCITSYCAARFPQAGFYTVCLDDSMEANAGVQFRDVELWGSQVEVFSRSDTLIAATQYLIIYVPPSKVGDCLFMSWERFQKSECSVFRTPMMTLQKV